MESAFEGDKTETKTILPVIEVFMAAHGLPDVTVRPQPQPDSSRSPNIEAVSVLGGNWEEYGQVVLQMAILDALLSIEELLTQADPS